MNTVPAAGRKLVFLDSSLGLAEARGICPEAEFLPPIRFGDLYALSGDTPGQTLIIDGVFHGARDDLRLKLGTARNSRPYRVLKNLVPRLGPDRGAASARPVGCAGGRGAEGALRVAIRGHGYARRLAYTHHSP